MSRFSEQQSQNFDHQIDEILRDLEELKTAQYTGQSSGMLAKLTTNSVKTATGDVVDFSYSTGSAIRTSEIPLTKTENEYSYNSITFTHRFKPNTNNPVVAQPQLEFSFSGNGLSGKSETTLNSNGQLTRSTNIYKNGAKIGTIDSTTGFSPWFNRVYSNNGDYVWETTLNYAVSENVVLHVKGSVISNSAGMLTTTAKGYYAAG